MREPLLVAIFFVLLGPPLGAILFGVIATIAAPFTDAGGGIGLLPLYAVLLALPLSWVTGFVPAAFVGLFTALWLWRRGPVPARIPVLTAATIAIVGNTASAETTGLWLLLLTVHLLTAALLWLAAARICSWPVRF
jgi:hypothetical protein